MPKPLTASERRTVDQIARELAETSGRSGKPMTIKDTGSFSAIKSHGGKIRIARSFSAMVESGELSGLRKSGTNSTNHTLYAASGGIGGTAAGGDTGKATAKKGFFQRLFGG